MRVVLKRLNEHGRPIRKAEVLRPRVEVFEQALLGMRVPREIIEKVSIVIDFRFMIPSAGVVMHGNNNFCIYIGPSVKDSINESVAHELKHIAIEIHRPKEFRTDKKGRGPYKWEELDCKRAEKKWGRLEYFEDKTAEVEANENLVAFLF